MIWDYVWTLLAITAMAWFGLELGRISDQLVKIRDLLKQRVDQEYFRDERRDMEQR